MAVPKLHFLSEFGVDFYDNDSVKFEVVQPRLSR
jgi:hypothetical protein